MISFFIKHKKVKGVITVFLTIVYLSTYLLIGLFVDGGRIRMAQTTMEDVQQVATENVMSQYHRGLYEYYGLFGISNYETDQIVKDVKSQIEESIGLKIPADTVKSFMEDTVVAGKSAIDNVGLIFNNGNVIENGKNFLGEIKGDLSNYHKRFDPYGITIEEATVSYIDLSNEEALRAQIRDEMRYTAPLVLGANFFSCINQLISLGDATDAVSDIADTIENTTDNIEKKRKEYIESLGTTSKTFKKFVENTYDNKDVKWYNGVKVEETIKRIQKIKVEDVVNSVVNIGKSFVETIFNLFSNKITESEKIENMEAAEAEIEKPYEIATDMHLNSEEGGGFFDVINNSDVLSRFYNEFDYCPPGDEDYPNDYESCWPYGKAIDPVYDYDENGHRYISGYEYKSRSKIEHKNLIAKKADNLKITYESHIEEIKNLIENTISKIDDTTNKADITLEAIGVAESRFQTGAEKSASNKSKTIYLSNMETYLRAYNDIATQKNELLVMKEKMEDLIEILDNAKEDVSRVVNQIKNESPYQGFRPSHRLSTYRALDKERFHTIVYDLQERNKIIESFQNTADSESISNDVFKLINAVFSEKDKDKQSLATGSTINGKPLYGTIVEHKKSGNILYDPSSDALDEKKEEKFEDKNIITKVKNIMDTAKDIIDNLPKDLFNNIYDEAYILSHCRDYVHTHRYVENKYTEKDDSYLKSNNIDTVLNTKFVKDQSNTNYLTDKEFRDIQVTPAEIEYILWGKREHELVFNNVATMYANIFILRLAINYIAALTSPKSFAEISKLAAGATVFAPVVFAAAPLIYAIPQSIRDTKEIMYDCKEVVFWNGGKDLTLYSAFTEMGKDIAKDAYNKIKEKAEKVIENVRENLDIIAVVAAVRSHNPPTNIVNACSYVINNKNLLDKRDDTGISDTFDDNKVRAGYSDYLLIYLFIGGMKDKNKQINRLQDIIQTNMQYVDNEFELRNTYSQIGVETESSIKYIFMTQSIMKNTFTSTKDYNKFPLKIKTSFAY